MNRFIPFLLTAILLTGCVRPQLGSNTAVTTPPTTLAPTTEPTAATTAPTEPEHSRFYMDRLATEDVIGYFGEVCLATEYATGDGNPNLVQKWDEPIYYRIIGAATQEDLAVIQEFFSWLNTVEGFPGASVAPEGETANLRIHFTDPEGMVQVLGPNYMGMEGAVTYWYDDNRIYTEDICILTSLDQQLRSSVILEELYNGTGLCQDTTTRTDSIIYQHSSTNLEMSPIDKLLLSLAYHPSIKPGMNFEECAAVIAQLYY